MIDVAIAIASALVLPLARRIGELIDSGMSEDDATRKALAELAAKPDLEPVLPKVRAQIAAAREKG